MTFERWNERFNEYRTISAVGAASEIASWPPEILADWKAEREKLIADNRRLQERVRKLFDGLWDAGKYLAGLGENIEAEKAFEALRRKEGE